MFNLDGYLENWIYYIFLRDLLNLYKDYILYRLNTKSRKRCDIKKIKSSVASQMDWDRLLSDIFSFVRLRFWSENNWRKLWLKNDFFIKVFDFSMKFYWKIRQSGPSMTFSPISHLYKDSSQAVTSILDTTRQKASFSTNLFFPALPKTI